MKTIENSLYAKAVLKSLKEKETHLKKVFEKTGIQGVYLVGGTVRDSIAGELYGNDFEKSDYDFFIDDLNQAKDSINLFRGLNNVTYSRFGCPKLNFDDFEIDLVYASNNLIAKKMNVEPTIENFVRYNNITTSAIGFSMENGSFTYHKGIDDIENKKINLLNPGLLYDDFAKIIIHAEKLGFEIGEETLSFIREKYGPEMNKDIIKYLNYKNKSNKIQPVLQKLKQIKKS